jgi:muramoyltetrapeptide carboxypeptidase
MFADKRIKAIFASQGGEGANTCLPYLDYSVMKEKPKVFLGMSDITVLLNAIYSEAGLVTFHGGDVIWGFSSPSRYDREEFVGRLIQGKIGKVRKNSTWKSVRKGVAKGRLLGGLLGVLVDLAGTTYLPDFSGSILFLESFKPTPATCYRHFSHLKQMGVFDKVNGVVVGYIYGLQTSKRPVTQMEDILLKVAGEYDVPILKMNDFGHNCPNTVLPVGCRVRLDATAKELEILEPCVS